MLSGTVNPWTRGRVMNSIIEFTKSGPETLIRYESIIQRGQYYQAFADEEVAVLKDDIIELDVPAGQIPQPLASLPMWPMIVKRLEEKYGISFQLLTPETMGRYPALQFWQQASHVKTIQPRKIIDETRKIDYHL